MCNCLEKEQKNLTGRFRGFKAKILKCFSYSDNLNDYFDKPAIRTLLQKYDKKHDIILTKEINIPYNYCPFCGRRYEDV